MAGFRLELTDEWFQQQSRSSMEQSVDLSTSHDFVRLDSGDGSDTQRNAKINEPGSQDMPVWSDIDNTDPDDKHLVLSSLPVFVEPSGPSHHGGNPVQGDFEIQYTNDNRRVGTPTRKQTPVHPEARFAPFANHPLSVAKGEAVSHDDDNHQQTQVGGEHDIKNPVSNFQPSNWPRSGTPLPAIAPYLMTPTWI